MQKSVTLSVVLALGLSLGLHQQAAAQSEPKKEEAKEVLVRPVGAVGPSIDAFSGKAFDVYEESIKITKAMEFVKVETKEVPDKGDGVTTEVKISDGKGNALTKMGALSQLGELMLRTTRQMQNIADVQSLQSAATQELGNVAVMSKMKAAKKMSKSTDALLAATTETKRQGSLIQQQISTLNALKNN